MGIKPLYYYLNNKEIIFSSELKSIKKAIKLNTNKQAISSYLHFGYIPKSETFYERTFKFPSASVGVFENNKLEIKPYWKYRKN